MSSATTNLLPQDHEEFRTKEYWDTFFKKRGNEAFEWYGSYPDVSKNLNRCNLENSAQFLAIGCGNSNFSTDLYDAGFPNITNIDFSDLVIDEMRLQNEQLRPQMKWKVADMTDMKGVVGDNSVDVVVDKGALDALLSVDNAETQAQGVAMFNDLSRVLVDGGRYICITLAEEFILKALVSYFVMGNQVKDTSVDWSLTLETLDTSTPTQQQSLKGKLATNSPFTPIVWIFQKHVKPEVSMNGANNDICCSVNFDILGNYMPSVLGGGDSIMPAQDIITHVSNSTIE